MNDRCPVKHAKSYPFHIPDGSYVVDQDGWRPIAPTGTHDTHGRHGVIASGSNASPDHLAAKFNGLGHLMSETIPVIRGVLHDFDTVYSAHISSYGSIPATLHPAPGAMADVFITWLTDAQLNRMHETESVGVNYDYAQLNAISLVTEAGAGFTQSHAYISKRGCLTKDGNPVPLAATRTEGRHWQAMNQAEVLDYARTVTAPDESCTDRFIRAHIDCATTRAKRTKHLSETAQPFAWEGFKVLN